MQSRALRTFITISKLGAFTETAEQLGMTHSAVSMQMKTLENNLGVALFDRNFRPPRLTPLGRLVADRSAELLAVEDQILALCQESDDLNGRLRFGFVPTASVRLLPLFLKNAGVRVPKVEFDVEIAVSEVLAERVQSGWLDAAVVTATTTLLPNLERIELREEQMVFAIPGQHSTLDRLNDLAFLQFAPDVGIGQLIANHMAKHESHLNAKRIVLDSVEAIMQCVNHGIGYTLLPEPDVKTYGNLRQCSIVRPTQPLSRKLELIFAARGAVSNRPDRVAELFTEESVVDPEN